MIKSEYFGDDDFKCRCGCGMDISDKLKSLIFIMREDASVPFVITSGARCKSHNAKVGGKPDSAHIRGLAVDIACPTSSIAFAIEHNAHKNGIKRIGRNHPKKFIHIDIDESLPQNVSFQY
jgi:zinc D-Ala-D-Ala carboxypeptidase